MKTGTHLKSVGVLVSASVLGLLYTLVWLPIYLEPDWLFAGSLVLHGGFLVNFLQSGLCALALFVLSGFHPLAVRLFFFASIPISIALASVPAFVNSNVWAQAMGTWLVLALVLPVLAFALLGWIQNQLRAGSPKKIPWLIFYTVPVWGFGVWCVAVFHFADGPLPSNQVFFFSLYWVFALGLALCMSVLGRSAARRLNGGWFWLLALAGGVVLAWLQVLVIAPVESLYAARYAAKVTLGWNNAFSQASLQHAVYSFGPLLVPIHFLYSLVYQRASQRTA